MKHRHWLAGVLLCASLFAMPARAEHRLHITLSNQEWPPYMGEHLPYDGILSRLVKEAFARGGVDVAYRFYPNNRTLQSARNGSVDGSFGWAPTAERMKDLLYTQPVLSAHMVFFQRKDARHPWQQLSDLAGLRVGVTIGDFYSDEFERLVKAGKLKTDVVGDDVANLRKLAAGRIDLFPIDQEVGRYLVARQLDAADGRELEAQDKSFWSAPLHVVIWRKHAHGAELVQRFNHGLKLLQGSGDFDRLVAETRAACLAK